MRERPTRIIEELRMSAEMDSVELGEPVSDFIETDAADYIEHLRNALGSIADGVADPATIAVEALDDAKWVASRGPKADAS